MDVMTEMEQALGAEVVRSLEQRRLLCEMAVPEAGTADAGVRADRIAGLITGLAYGNAGADGRVGVETQTFVLSAEAWLDHGWRAPGALAEQLSRELHTLRVRGEAIGAAVDAHRNGVPWHLAASTSYGNGGPQPGRRRRGRARRPAGGRVARRVRRHCRDACRPARRCRVGHAGHGDRRPDPARPVDIAGRHRGRRRPCHRRCARPANAGARPAVRPRARRSFGRRCGRRRDGGSRCRRDHRRAGRRHPWRRGAAAGVAQRRGRRRVPGPRPAHRRVDRSRARFGHLVPHRPLRLDGVDRPRRCGRVRPVLRQPAIDRR